MLHVRKRAFLLALTSGLACSSASAQAPPVEQYGLLVWSSHDGIVRERNEFAPTPKMELAFQDFDRALPSLDSKRLLVCEPRFHN